MVDYNVSNNKRFRYIFVIFNKFSKYTWCIPLKIKNAQTITDDFSKSLSTSKQKPVKIQSGRGKEIYNSSFKNYLKFKNIHHYSRLTDKDPSIAERVIRTISNLSKNLVFLNGNANWLSELPLVIKT